MLSCSSRKAFLRGRLKDKLIERKGLEKREFWNNAIDTKGNAEREL